MCSKTYVWFKTKIFLENKFVFPPDVEPRTLRVLGVRDNHYTTETLQVLSGVSNVLFQL